MKCPFCKKRIDENSQYCVYCGKKLDEPGEFMEHRDSRGRKFYSRELTDDELNFLSNFDRAAYEAKKKKTLGGIIKSVFSVLLFVVLMFFMQSLVTSAYTTALMAGDGTYSARLLELTGEGDTDGLSELMNEVTLAVVDKTVLILLVANLLTLLTLCLIFHFRHKNPLEEMSFYNTNPYRYMTFAFFGVALNIFVSVTLSFVSLPEEIMSSFESHYAPMYGSTAPGGIVTEVLSTAVVAGIVEEIIFRGIAMKRLVPSVGKPAAVILSALIFGIAHGTPVAIAYATMLGLILGTVYAVYGSVYPCIFIHVFFNFTSYLLEGAAPEIIGVLYLLSAVLIVYCTYRIFVRRPTWADICYDEQDRIPAVSPAEVLIKERLHQVQRGENTITIGEMDKLRREWEKVRAEYKKSKKRSKYESKPEKK